MEQRRPIWQDTFPLGWTRIGKEILERKEIQEDRYRTTIKERLMDGMAVPNILALTGAKSINGLNLDECLKRVGLHRGTLYRWINNQHEPEPRWFFGLLVVGLRREIDEVVLPRNREVIWEAVSRTLALIREKECDGDRRPPNRAEFACVRWLMRHPRVDELTPDHPNPDESRVDEILADVAHQTQRYVPDGTVRTGRHVRKTIMQWGEPYTLFRIALLRGWEFLDEIAV